MTFPQALKNITVRDEQTGRPMHSLDLFNNTISFTENDGRLVKMDLGQADVHIDAALANYAAGYRQVQGIADLVCPVVMVPKASNKFFTWDKDDVFQDAQDLIVGPDAAVKEISPRLSSASYSTISFGIGSFVPTEVEANADSPLSPYTAALGRCMNAINLGRERRVATLLTTSGSWSGGYTTTLGATAKWNGGSASNPVQDLMTAIEASLTPVRGIAMSEVVLHDFIQNPAVQKYTGYKASVAPLPNGILDKGWSGSIANFSQQSPDAFAALLGLPPIYVGFMKGKSGASTYGYVWGNNVPLLYNDPSAPRDGKSIASAYTFRWSGADGGVQDGTMQGGFLVRTYYDPRRGARGGKMIVVAHNDHEVMTSTVAGGLIISAHQ